MKIVFTPVLQQVWSLYKFLCSNFSVRNDILFNFLPWIMTNSLIDFNVLDGNGSGANYKKCKSQNFGQVRSDDLKATAQEQARIHIQQIQ